MNMKKFIPDEIRKIVNNLSRSFNNQASGSNSSNIELMTRKNSSMRRHQNDLDGINVISIERITTSTGIIVDKETYKNIRKYTISNLDSIAAAVEFIKTSEIKEELQNTETITEVKFQFGDESVRELNSHEIWEVSGRFSNKSISFCFCSRNDDSFYIYWKSKDSQNLMFLNPFNQKFGWKDRKLCDFVMMFLKSSLRNEHSGISQSFQLPIETVKVQLHYLADIRDYNLLLLAAEKGDYEVIKVLLDHGINTELANRSINAQILSYNNRHFEVLEMLIDENYTYPQSIDISQCTDNSKEFYKASMDLHEAIITGNQKKSVNLVMQHPKSRYFYNLQNESALKTALVHKQFKVYEALLKQGLYLAPHENILKIIKAYNEIENNNFKNIQIGDHPEQHMSIIIGNTSIFQEDIKTRERFTPIYSAYQALNANIFIKVILMVVAASKNFRVVFDFSHESVQSVDPNLSSKSNGFLYMTGRIFIGALKLLNFKTKQEAYGIMAHEFCHYAVDLTFGNDAKPYFKNDSLARQEFDKISEECEKRYGEEEVIDLVYDCYPEDMHHAELIVRVPQLLMLYGNEPEKLLKIQEKFPKLFKFFEVRVVPAMKKALHEIEAKAEIDFKVDDVIVREYPKRWSFFVVCGIVVAMLIGICGLLVIKAQLLMTKHNYKFQELSEPQKLTLMNARVTYKGLDMKLMDLLPDESAGYDELTSEQIECIFDSKLLNLTGHDFNYLQNHIIHNWTTVAAPIKSKILSTNFTFQDISLKFKILHDLHPSAFTALTSNQIVDILDGKDLKVGKMIDKIKGYQPYRNFVSENAYLLYHKYQTEPNITSNFTNYFQKFKDENFEFFSNIYDEISKNLLGMTLDSYIRYNLTSKVYFEVVTHINKFQITENLDKTKTFILASDDDDKNTIKMNRLTHLMKKEHPTRWVSFVDMKNAPYEPDKNSILELIGRSNVTGFEQRIFDECYKSGNLIVLWNDFGNFPPNLDNLLLDIMWDIHQNKNIQLISTKTSYSKTLRDKFHVEVHRFQPLTAREAESGTDESSRFLLNRRIFSNLGMSWQRF
ncbi:hypothetical protein ACKWTF_014396 [Chironomus riparius]